MDLSRQALQTNGKFFFSNFDIVFELMAENQRIFKRIARREYWSKCNVLYINGSSWQALETIENFFSIFELAFELLAETEKYLTNNKVGFMQANWGRQLCWSAHVLVETLLCFWLLIFKFVTGLE